jgi:hypothetical protein
MPNDREQRDDEPMVRDSDQDVVGRGDDEDVEEFEDTDDDLEDVDDEDEDEAEG